MPLSNRAVFFFLLSGHVVQAGYKWSEGEDRVRSILDGRTVYDGVDNSTIGEYLYFGPVAGLKDGYPKDDYITVTYDGCRKICGNPIAIYEAPRSLSLVTNWVFPLTILLSLPYESLHEGKIHRTLIAVLNWLGSPQTALTATVFNFRMFRQAHRHVLRDVNNYRFHLRCAAYFVLCSLNQFHINHLIGFAEGGGQPSRMLKALVYGLFRPLSNEEEPDVELTNQLLVQLAFQLRMLRRRGVIPMLANLATFLVAFIFAVVLAFAELGDENTPFSLSFGLLVTWLPLLVVFTIVDRNPVSSERTA